MHSHGTPLSNAEPITKAMETFKLGVLLILLLHSSDASKSPSNDITCQETVSNEDPSKFTAKCWIHPSVALMPCKPNWATLDFEVKTDENIGDITILRSTLFNHCAQLRVLVIWKGGPVTHLQRELFQPLYNLEKLIVRAENLRSIDKNFLLFLPNLQSLALTESNSLKRLGLNKLEPLPSQLTTLDLSYNQLIDVMQPGIFGNHPLRNLYLQYNKITGLYEESLLGLSELRLLKISYNQLSGSLENALGVNSPNSSSALITVPQLEILDLAGNYLTEIVGCRWSGGCGIEPVLKKLRVLNLAKNRLTWLDPKAFHGLPGLIELRLEGNPDLFHAGILPVVLFSLTRNDYPALRHLAIPQESPSDGALEMCAIDPLQMGTRIMSSAIEHLNKQFCEEPASETSKKGETHPEESNNSTAPYDTSENEGPVFAYIRQAKRWVLTCIAVALLLFGVLISGIIFACFYYGVRRPAQMIQEESFKEPIKPAVVYAPSHMSLHHIYTPELYRQAFLPTVQPIITNNPRFSGIVSTNGTPIMKGSNLNKHRNTSNSVYSLLSAPPNTVTPGIPMSSTNSINPQSNGIKHSVV